MAPAVWHGFDLAVAAWAIGWRTLDTLPDEAASALVAGADTPSLRVLAGLQGSTWSEVEPVLAAVFAERGAAMPTRAEAFKRTLDDWMREVVAGERTVMAFLERLDRIIWGGLPNELDAEIRDAFAWSVEYRNEPHLTVAGTRQALERDVLDQCRAFEARGGVSLS